MRLARRTARRSRRRCGRAPCAGERVERRSLAQRGTRGSFEESLAAAAPLLKGLANNRDFLDVYLAAVDRVDHALRDVHAAHLHAGRQDAAGGRHRDVAPAIHHQHRTGRNFLHRHALWMARVEKGVEPVEVCC
mgnify:CR=1 FL=1